MNMSIIKHYLLIYIAIAILGQLSGCSVYMAATQPGKKDNNVLVVGTPRSIVIAELGQPTSILIPPDIPQQPLIRSIHEWGNSIAVITEGDEQWMPSHEQPGYGLGIVDLASSRIVPFHGLHCNAYYDVGYSSELGKLLVCGLGKSARVYRQHGQSWTPITQSLPGNQFRIAVEGDRIAVVSEDIIYLISGSSNKGLLRIPLKIDDIEELVSFLFWDTLLLAEDTLLLAYNAGEFGGGLFQVDLSHPQVPPTEIVDAHVSVLARSKSGVVWAASGFRHMGVVAGSLYRINRDGGEVIASIAGVKGQQVEKISAKGVPFPGLTDVSGLVLNTEGYPVLLFPEFGVFEFKQNKFFALYEGPLVFSYHMPGYTMTSYPEGLVISPSGEFFVANRSLGIFVIQMKENHYVLSKQILFFPK